MLSVEQLQNIHIKAGGKKFVFNIHYIYVDNYGIKCGLVPNDKTIEWIEISGIKNNNNIVLQTDTCMLVPKNGKIILKNLNVLEFFGEFVLDNKRVGSIYVGFN